MRPTCGHFGTELSSSRVQTPRPGPMSSTLRSVSDHNALYHRDLLNAIPEHAASALDIGCGDGALVRALAAKVGHATGIDRHEPSIARARAASDPAATTFVLGDAAAHPFKPASFDVVTAVAMLHHGDAREGLARMIDLLAPGGMLGVIGLAARPTNAGDVAMDALAIARVRVTVSHFLARGRAHVHDLHFKMQCLAGERMIAVEHHDAVGDFHHREW